MLLCIGYLCYWVLVVHNKTQVSVHRYNQFLCHFILTTFLVWMLMSGVSFMWLRILLSTTISRYISMFVSLIITHDKRNTRHTRRRKQMLFGSQWSYFQLFGICIVRVVVQYLFEFIFHCYHLVYLDVDCYTCTVNGNWHTKYFVFLILACTHACLVWCVLVYGRIGTQRNAGNKRYRDLLSKLCI